MRVVPTNPDARIIGIVNVPVVTVFATALPDNDASVHLMRRLGLGWVATDGVLEGSGTLRLLDPARVDRGAVLALADRPASDYERAVSRAASSGAPPPAADRSRGTLVMNVSATETSETMPITV